MTLVILWTLRPSCPLRVLWPLCPSWGLVLPCVPCYPCPPGLRELNQGSSLWLSLALSGSLIYAHELQLVDMGGEHNEEAVQQEYLCYHAHAMVQQCGTMVQQCHYSTQVEQ